MSGTVLLLIMTLTRDYGRLLDQSKELAIVSSAGSILQWDMETKMPPRGVGLKSEQLAWIQKVAHQMLTSPKSGSLIESIEKHKDYDSLDNVHEIPAALSISAKAPGLSGQAIISPALCIRRTSAPSLSQGVLTGTPVISSISSSIKSILSLTASEFIPVDEPTFN